MNIQKMTRADCIGTAIKFYEGGGRVGVQLEVEGPACRYLAKDGGRCSVGTLMLEWGMTDAEIRSLNRKGAGSLQDEHQDLLASHLEEDVFTEEMGEGGMMASFLEKFQEAHDEVAELGSGAVVESLREFAKFEGVEL